MTVKELRKLRRRDLLQLLVEQSKEELQIKGEKKEKEEEILQIEESNARLKSKIEEKDVQIEKLAGRLDSKKDRIKALEAEIEARNSSRMRGLGSAGTVAEAVLRLNGIVEAAQKAADQYLYNIRQRCEEQSSAIYTQPETDSIGGSER